MSKSKKNETIEEAFYQLLCNEKSYYDAIWHLTIEETAILKEKRSFKELKPLIEKKAYLLMSVAKIDASFEALKKRWKERGESMGPFTERILKELGKLKELLFNLKDLQENNSNMLAEERLMASAAFAMES